MPDNLLNQIISNAGKVIQFPLSQIYNLGVATGSAARIQANALFVQQAQAQARALQDQAIAAQKQAEQNAELARSGAPVDLSGVSSIVPVTPLRRPTLATPMIPPQAPTRPALTQAATIPTGTPATIAPVAALVGAYGKKYEGYEQYVTVKSGGQRDMGAADLAIVADRAIMTNYRKGLISTTDAVVALRNLGLAGALQRVAATEGEGGPTETTFPTEGGGTMRLPTPVFASDEIARYMNARYPIAAAVKGVPSVQQLQRYTGMSADAAQRALDQIKKDEWYDANHPTLGISTYFTKTGGYLIVNEKAGGQGAATDSPFYKVVNYNPATDNVTMAPGVSPANILRGARIGTREPALPTRSIAQVQREEQAAAKAAGAAAVAAARLAALPPAHAAHAETIAYAGGEQDPFIRIFGLPSFGASGLETGPPKEAGQKELLGGWIAGIPIFGDIYRAGQRFAADKTQEDLAKRYESPLGDYLLDLQNIKLGLGEEEFPGPLMRKSGPGLQDIKKGITFAAGMPEASAKTWSAGDVVLSDVLTETGAMPEYKPEGSLKDIPGGMYEFVRKHPGTSAELPLLGHIIGPAIGAVGYVSPLAASVIQDMMILGLGWDVLKGAENIISAPEGERYSDIGGWLAPNVLMFGPSAGEWLYEKAPIRPGFETYEMPSGGKATMFGIQSRRGSPIPEMRSLLARTTGLPDESGGLIRRVVGQIDIGTADIPLEKIIGPETLKGMEPGVMDIESTGPGATRILEKSVAGLEGGGEETGKWSIGREIRAITSKSGVEVGAMRPQLVDIATEHNLPNEEKVADAMIRVMKVDMAKGEQGYMYGSPIQRAAGETMGEPGLPRVGKDVDYMAMQEKAFQKEMVDAINDAAGKNVVSAEGGKIKDLNGKTLFDIHQAKIAAEYGRSGPLPGMSPPIGDEYIALGIKAEPKVLTAEGMRTMSPSEQASRKLLGSSYTISLEPRTLSTPSMTIEGRIMPVYEGRVKDIGDFYYAEKTNIKALEMAGKTGKATKASEKLESWLDLWGTDNAARIRADYAARTASGEGYQFPTMLSPGAGAPVAGMDEAWDVLTRAAYLPPGVGSPSAGVGRISTGLQQTPSLLKGGRVLELGPGSDPLPGATDFIEKSPPAGVSYQGRTIGTDYTKRFPASSGTFDSVVVAKPITNISRAFGEVYRVLKPEGQFTIMAHRPGASMYDYLDLVTGDTDYVRELKKIGFGNVQIHNKGDEDWFITAEKSAGARTTRPPSPPAASLQAADAAVMEYLRYTPPEAPTPAARERISPAVRERPSPRAVTSPEADIAAAVFGYTSPEAPELRRGSRPAYGIVERGSPRSPAPRPTTSRPAESPPTRPGGGRSPGPGGGSPGGGGGGGSGGGGGGGGRKDGGGGTDGGDRDYPPQKEREQKPQERQTDESYRWRKTYPPRAIHTYSEVSGGAEPEEAMAFIFGMEPMEAAPQAATRKGSIRIPSGGPKPSPIEVAARQAYIGLEGASSVAGKAARKPVARVKRAGGQKPPPPTNIDEITRHIFWV